MNCSAVQRIGPQGNAKQRNTAQRNAKQIGLAIGISGLPDVFSHQAHRIAGHGKALQSTARQRKAPRLGHWKQCPRQVVLTHSEWETPAV